MILKAIYLNTWQLKWHLPAVSSQVKGHAETLLAGLDVGLVEGITLLYRRETSVL